MRHLSEMLSLYDVSAKGGRGQVLCDVNTTKNHYESKMWPRKNEASRLPNFKAKSKKVLKSKNMVVCT